MLIGLHGWRSGRANSASGSRGYRSFQRVAIVLLLFSLMLQCFSKMIVVADFYANRDYIAKNLCINRYQTAISCGGKCQLNKRLREENKENGETGSRPDDRYEVLSSRCYYLTCFNPWTPRVTTSYPFFSGDSPVDQPAVIFHPPGWLLVSFRFTA